MELLRVENLNFTYAGGKQALEDINFSLEEGETLCVCGPTGSGKSTLLRLLKREISPRGTKSGEIYLNGRRQEDLSEIEAATKVGFVMQRPDMQIVTDKVWHELAFGLENLVIKKNEIRRRVCEIAGYFGMEEWFDKSTDSLSGGQKQLLNLASVMVMQPGILILDEPVSQLDPIAASDFIATIGKLAREFGISIIVAEQRLEELIPASDKILALRDGKIAEFGKTRECALKLVKDEVFAPFMPASARIFAKLTQSIEDFQIPLSVGDGRRFLKDLIARDESVSEKIASAIGDTTGKNDRSASKGSEAALEFREVFFSYERNGKDVLKSLSFKVMKGEIFCILGGNGAGKSTAISAAAGLVKPYSGKIKVFGKNIRDYKGQELYRECVALLPQDVQTVFLTDDINGRHPYDLSGGEQQLAALEIVLSTNPKLLLLDEPTKGIDRIIAGSLGKKLKELAASGVTVVVVSHDVEFAASVADRCALLFNGEIVSVCESREFFEGNYFYTTALNRLIR